MVDTISLYICAFLLVAAFAMTIFRLIRGPSIFDRLLSLDLVTSLTMAALILLALVSRNFVWLDVVLALALIAFLGTVAFAAYLERSSKDDSSDNH